MQKSVERVVICKIQQRGYSFEKSSREGGHMKTNIAERVVSCKISREGGHLQKYGREGTHLAERVVI